MPETPNVPMIPGMPDTPDWKQAIAQRLGGERAQDAEGAPDVVEEIAQHLQDRYDELRAAGAAAIFGPGTVIADAAIDLLKQLSAQES